MEWLEWAATDAAIRAELGYTIASDRASAHRLRTLVPPEHRLRDLTQMLRGRTDIVVVGCGPSLDQAKPAALSGKLVVAADGAASWLREEGVVPHIVVTDLDGKPDDLVWAAKEGAAMLVHAHGDNQDAVRDLAPLVGPRLYGTYQGPPVPGLAPLANPGGFTDGDRAVVLCEHLGAKAATLVGFDFDRPPGVHSHRWDPQTKPKKLAWARRILEGVQERGRMRIERSS